MYNRNGLKFDTNATHTIDGVQYPRGWFLDTSIHGAFGIVEVPDPIYPDQELFTFVENPDGSITSTPRSIEVTTSVLAGRERARITKLWQAAHDYEYERISGMATSLLVLGVLQNLPKSMAIKAWSKSIWAQYFIRKATGSTDTDFTFAGPMPYSVSELMAELGE